MEGRHSTVKDGRVIGSGASPRSSRRSHAFASFQSRITVSGETCSASAVSSTLNPPKNRISITRLFRSSSFGQCLERVVQGDQIAPRFVRERQVVNQCDPDRAAAALLIRPGAREIDQDASHQPRGHGEEMRAVLPVDAAAFDETQIDLVDERGRLEAVPALVSRPYGRARSDGARRGRSGTSRSSAASSPCPHAMRSFVTSGEAVTPFTPPRRRGRTASATAAHPPAPPQDRDARSTRAPVHPIAFARPTKSSPGSFVPINCLMLKCAVNSLSAA